MTKSPKSFRLSDDAIALLNELKERWNLASEAEVVEKLIFEQQASDKHENNRRRRLAFEQFAENRELPPGAEKIFYAGYNQGWINFQLRHTPIEEIEVAQTALNTV